MALIQIGGNMGGDSNNLGGLGLGASLIGSGTQLVGAIQGGKQGQRTAAIGRPIAQIGGTVADYSMAQRRLAQQEQQQQAYQELVANRLAEQEEKQAQRKSLFEDLTKLSANIPKEDRGTLDLAIKSGDPGRAITAYGEVQKRRQAKSAAKSLLPKSIRDNPEEAAMFENLAGEVGISQAYVQFRADQAQKAAALRGERDARQALLQQAELEGRKLSPTQKQIMSLETNLPQLFVPGITQRDLRTRVQSLLKSQKVSEQEQARFLKTVDEAYKAAQTKSNFLGTPTEAGRDLFVEEFLKRNFPQDAINEYKSIAQRQQQLRQQAEQPAANTMTPEMRQRLEELRRRKGM